MSHRFYDSKSAEGRKGGYVGVDKTNMMTEDQKVYERGMTYLSKPASKKGSRTVVELYTELQEVYTAAVSAKTKAFRVAREHADANNEYDEEAANIEYNKWVDESAVAWRNRVQAAYMNWVVTGRKEEVEFWFAVVDQETAMSRIELSKVHFSHQLLFYHLKLLQQFMRSAVVQAEDGSCEYYKVKLEPRNWCVIPWICISIVMPNLTRSKGKLVQKKAEGPTSC